MNFLSIVIPLLLACVGGVLVLRVIQGSNGWIEMPEDIFWRFVATHAPADVLVVLRGTLFKRSCYVYAHHGLVLFTWSRPVTSPAGVTETLTFELQRT